MSMSWKKIRQDIEHVVTSKAYSSIILAVSGGVDSIFLLDFMRRHKLLNRVFVVHFNHLPGQRMDDSAMRVVRKYCEEEDVPLYIGVTKDREKMLSAPSFESEARKQRYQHFLSVIQTTAKDDPRPGVIMTAHNLSDQIEGILMGMCRGVPIQRVAMAKETFFTRHNVMTFRPLLDIPKSAIVRQATRFFLEGRWEDDVTNSDVKYERNFMRHAVVPLLMTRRNVLKSIPKSVPTPQRIEVTRGTLFETE